MSGLICRAIGHGWRAARNRNLRLCIVRYVACVEEEDLLRTYSCEDSASDLFNPNVSNQFII